MLGSANRMIAKNVEWMLDARDRTRGLLKYSEAPDSYAGIFKLPFLGILPIIHTFGMKFRIDIVYCDSYKRVIEIKKNIGPNRFVVPWKLLLGGARYAIEFSKADISDLSRGQKLEWLGS